jgi:signal transduction histidine kinase
LRLLSQLHDALRRGGRFNIERSFKSLLRHRARYVIDSRLDLPSMLAAIDKLSERGANPELLSALLRDGLREGGIILIEGLQPALLRRRERFTADDFDFLASRVLQLSELAGVDSDDFRARAQEPPSRPFAVPRTLVLPSLLQGGTWYARSDGSGRIVGAAVDAAALIAEIDAQMRERALIEPEDFLELPELVDDSVPVATLPMTITAPRFAERIVDAHENFRVKSLSLVGSVGLALVIVVLSVVLASRKQRFVELKNDFVATVSHELRTPLASLRLMAETVERRTAGFAAARDYPTRMVREIDELAFLVENILSFNRIDKGRWRPRRERVDLQALVEHVANDLAPFTSKPLHVRARGLEGVVVRGDPELLRLLFHNLGKNACAYCERDQVEIEVSAVHATGWLRRGLTVLVRDNGIGIPRREHRRIFGDFYRGHRNPGARGSGLGLAICRKTMAAHGGRIRIAASSAAGTTFALDFPVSSHEAS